MTLALAVRATESQCFRMRDHEDNFVFTTVTPHMIHFWNPWHHGSAQEVFSVILVIIRMVRKVKNAKKLGIWRIFDHLKGEIPLETKISA